MPGTVTPAAPSAWRRAPASRPGLGSRSFQGILWGSHAGAGGSVHTHTAGAHASRPHSPDHSAPAKSPQGFLCEAAQSPCPDEIARLEMLFLHKEAVRGGKESAEKYDCRGQQIPGKHAASQAAGQATPPPTGVALLPHGSQTPLRATPRPSGQSHYILERCRSSRSQSCSTR